MPRCELCLANPTNRPHRCAGSCHRYRKEQQLKALEKEMEEKRQELAAILKQQQQPKK